QVGPLLITSESSIESNIRRVEALTGEDACQRLAEMRDTLNQTGRLLRVPAHQVPERVEALRERVGRLEDRLEEVATERRANLAGDLAAAADEIGDRRLVVADVGEMAPGDLRQLALDIRNRLGAPSLVVVGSRHNGTGALAAAADAGGAGRDGISAGGVAERGGAGLGGGGGRAPERAQAGGPRGGQLERALDIVREVASRRLRG